MKKKSLIILLAAVLALVMSGCTSANFSMSGSDTKLTVKVTADDGMDTVSTDISVGKNRHVEITSNLDKGSIKIEFMQIVKILDDDSLNDYIEMGIEGTTTITGKETSTVELPAGDYIMYFTAVGNTSGQFVVKVVKD